jgi:hypothetical protein
MFDNFHSALTFPFLAGYAEEENKKSIWEQINPLSGACLDSWRHSIDTSTASLGLTKKKGSGQPAVDQTLQHGVGCTATENNILDTFWRSGDILRG